MLKTTRQPVTPRSHCSSSAPFDPMNHQQHDPDQEQDPGNLNRHRGYPGQIQGSGNDSNHQEYQCVVQHIALLSIRRFSRITESSMDPQFTHLIFGRLFSRTLSRSPPQTSIISNPPHRAHAISPPLPPSQKPWVLFTCQLTIGQPYLGHTPMLDLWRDGN